MKPRARRIALLTVAAGCLVLAGLVAFNWDAVRDHAEAWWFQVTRETKAMTPGPFPQESARARSFVSGDGLVMAALQDLADRSARTVIFDAAAAKQVGLYAFKLQHDASTLEEIDVSVSLQAKDADDPARRLRAVGWTILDLRFPHRAFVVTGYPTLEYEPRQRLRGGATTTVDVKATSR
jgi:hypothetical protein